MLSRSWCIEMGMMVLGRVGEQGLCREPSFVAGPERSRDMPDWLEKSFVRLLILDRGHSGPPECPRNTVGPSRAAARSGASAASGESPRAACQLHECRGKRQPTDERNTNAEDMCDRGDRRPAGTGTGPGTE